MATVRRNDKDFIERYLKRKGFPLDIAVTFEDMTIVDQYSAIPHRSDEYIDTASNLGKGVVLKRPIFSANMDTITGSRMAIALARLGACGVIPQFMPIEDEVSEVNKVKRADGNVILEPLTISPGSSVKEARFLMDDFKISGLIVVDDGTREVVGILTQRDVRWASDTQLVKDRMTPFNQLIFAPQNIDIEDAKKILFENRIEKLPLISKGNPRQCVGLITASDILKREHYKFAFRDKKGRLGVAAATGIGSDMLKRIEALLKAETDMIFIDTARGNSERMKKALREARRQFGNDFLLVAGNVDTPEGVEMLFEAGADVAKVGIGGGAACKTREGAGVGIPQLWAVAAASAVGRKYGKKIISDGGIRIPADYCKSLAAGADATMIGGVFAGTEETPGEVFFEDGREWKIFRGSASLEFQMSRTDRDSDEPIRAPEGVARRVPYKGSVANIIGLLTKYQYSSMSYVGSSNMEEFHKAKFMRQTKAGSEEGKPHEVF